MNTHVTGIVAKLSSDDLLETGKGAGTLWEYPESAGNIMALPLTRLTVFDMNSITVSEEVSKGPCKLAVVDATVWHCGYGIMKATLVNVTRIIE